MKALHLLVEIQIFPEQHQGECLTFTKILKGTAEHTSSSTPKNGWETQRHWFVPSVTVGTECKRGSAKRISFYNDKNNIHSSLFLPVTHAIRFYPSCYKAAACFSSHWNTSMHFSRLTLFFTILVCSEKQRTATPLLPKMTSMSIS